MATGGGPRAPQGQGRRFSRLGRGYSHGAAPCVAALRYSPAVLSETRAVIMAVLSYSVVISTTHSHLIDRARDRRGAHGTERRAEARTLDSHETAAQTETPEETQIGPRRPARRSAPALTRRTAVPRSRCSPRRPWRRGAGPAPGRGPAPAGRRRRACTHVQRSGERHFRSWFDTQTPECREPRTPVFIIFIPVMR